MEAVERAVRAERHEGAARKRAARRTEEIPALPRSEDERKIEELIASKREQAAALEKEHAEYERVRAHLGELISHNLASLDRVAQELDELEAMRGQVRRIRTALDRG
ncbi:MAG TPA: hypothetical protein VL283_01060 [Candidatus Baltobacteraceae bacterium]|nr:hypothetical protein [Candidatus Baltobacteraceae bacterium]